MKKTERMNVSAVCGAPLPVGNTVLALARTFPVMCLRQDDRSRRADMPQAHLLSHRLPSRKELRREEAIGYEED